jgi:ABC-2 type transport system permease protein/lipopolysaccharide transport system permease protein
MTTQPSSNLRLSEDAWPAPQSPVSAAWSDIINGAAKSWLWMALAFQDIKLRYRGSVLGPFWLTITTVVMVASMGVIYSTLFEISARDYLPYLTIGLIAWSYISTVISDGCQTFLSAEGIIQTVPLPYSVHAYRAVFRNLIVLAHSLVIIPLALLIFQIPVGWRTLEVVPALILYALNGVWISVLFGMLSARYRDIPPIVANFTQVLFFVTPVIYPASLLGPWRAVADLNPAFAAIDVMRAPLLGVATSTYSWPMFLVTTATGCLATFIIFARFRARIAYWT